MNESEIPQNKQLVAAAPEHNLEYSADYPFNWGWISGGFSGSFNLKVGWTVSVADTASYTATYTPFMAGWVNLQANLTTTVFGLTGVGAHLDYVHLYLPTTVTLYSNAVNATGNFCFNASYEFESVEINVNTVSWLTQCIS
jgi:hypothetical protein